MAYLVPNPDGKLLIDLHAVADGAVVELGVGDLRTIDARLIGQEHEHQQVNSAEQLCSRALSRHALMCVRISINSYGMVYFMHARTLRNLDYHCCQ